MKTRNGFVSNSSSSSFVVTAYNFDGEKILDAERENILKKYGFDKTTANYSIHVEMGNKSPCNRNKDYNYAFSVSVNQDDVIYFLLKNNISFEGCCHYGNETIIYKQNGKYFLTIPNFGLEYGCYFYKNESIEKSMKRLNLFYKWETLTHEDIFKKINVKEFIKNYEKWNKDIK